MDKMNELLSMVEKNPNHEVKFFISTDNINDDYSHNQQDIHKVELSDYCVYNSQIYTDYDELIDQLIYENDLEDATEELEKQAAILFDQVILVTLGYIL